MSAITLEDCMTQQHHEPPPPSQAVAGMFDRAAPTLLGAVAIGIVSVLLAGWRNEPVTTAELAALRSEVAAMRQDAEARERRVIALEASDRQRTAELAHITKTLEKIEAYNGKTMQEITSINLQFAEMRGAKRPAKSQ